MYLLKLIFLGLTGWGLGYQISKCSQLLFEFMTDAVWVKQEVYTPEAWQYFYDVIPMTFGASITALLLLIFIAWITTEKVKNAACRIGRFLKVLK